MATRAVIIIKDGDTQHVVYRHWDGYPNIDGDGVLPDLKRLLTSGLVWKLPRFEADEFAAGMVALMKQGEGNLRLVDPSTYNYRNVGAPFGEEYQYVVEYRDSELIVYVREWKLPELDPATLEANSKYWDSGKWVNLYAKVLWSALNERDKQEAEAEIEAQKMLDAMDVRDEMPSKDDL